MALGLWNRWRFSRAIRRGDIALVDRLLRSGLDPNDVENIWGASPGITPLILAASCGHVEIMGALIKSGADVNKKPAGGLTALQSAAGEGRQDVVDYLVRIGADLDAITDYSDATALQYAVTEGHNDIAIALIRAGADPNSAMTAAATLGSGASAGQKDKISILASAITRRGHVVAEALLNAGANPNAEGTNGITPLIFAAHAGDLESTQLLVHGGSNVDHHMSDNSTALSVARAAGHDEVVQFLKLSGALEPSGIQRQFAAFMSDRTLADESNADAQFALGVAYAYGHGVPQDDVQAAAWYSKAAEQGYAPAQEALGGAYARGTGVEQDYAKAAAWYRKAAEQGVPSAQHALGMAHGGGKGVRQDDGQSAVWLRKAADQGYASAQYELGGAYSKGRGVPQDPKQASAWYDKAANQGYGPAQYILGIYCVNGLGVPKDLAKAYMWFKLALMRAADEKFRNLNLAELLSLSDKLTASQIADVERCAREWQTAFEQKR